MPVLRSFGMACTPALASAKRYDVLTWNGGSDGTTLRASDLPRSCVAVCVYTSGTLIPQRDGFERLVTPVVDAGRRWRGWKRLWCTALLAAAGAGQA